MINEHGANHMFFITSSHVVCSLRGNKNVYANVPVGHCAKESDGGVDGVEGGELYKSIIILLARYENVQWTRTEGI